MEVLSRVSQENVLGFRHGPPRRYGVVPTLFSLGNQDQLLQPAGTTFIYLSLQWHLNP